MTLQRFLPLAATATLLTLTPMAGVARPAAPPTSLVRVASASKVVFGHARRARARHRSARAARVATAGETPQPLGAAGAWTLRFDDEFRGTTLNAAKWQPDWLAVNNTTVTPPVNVSDVDCTDPGAVQVSGGILHLRAAARSCTASNGRTYPFASGLVNTHNSFTFTHGFMEARIDVPATSAGTPANFPAFWADGTGTWPTSGELDVMEVNGNCGPGEGFHFHSSAGAFGGCSGLRPAPGWHTFGADWQPSGVSYYYDGHLVGRLTTGITSTPMYLVLDNNVDPTWGGPSLAPADLQVDYVRVWQ